MKLHWLLTLLLAISSCAVAVYHFPAFYPAAYPLHYSPNALNQRLLSIYKSYNISISKLTTTTTVTKTITSTTAYAVTCTLVTSTYPYCRKRRGMPLEDAADDGHFISPSAVQRMEMTQEPTSREGRAAAPQIYPHHPAATNMMMDYFNGPQRLPGWDTHHHHHYYYNTPEIVSGFDISPNLVADDPTGLADTIESGFSNHDHYYSSDCAHNKALMQLYYNDQARIPNNKGRHFFQNLSAIFSALRKTVTATSTVTSMAISVYYVTSTATCYSSYGTLPQCPNYGR